MTCTHSPRGGLTRAAGSARHQRRDDAPLSGRSRPYRDRPLAGTDQAHGDRSHEPVTCLTRRARDDRIGPDLMGDARAPDLQAATQAVRRLASR